MPTAVYSRGRVIMTVTPSLSSRSGFHIELLHLTFCLRQQSFEQIQSPRSNRLTVNPYSSVVRVQVVRMITTITDDFLSFLYSNRSILKRPFTTS